jgi:hypothetical protein
VPVIKANLGIVTQINVFTVPEGGNFLLKQRSSRAVCPVGSRPAFIAAATERASSTMLRVRASRRQNASPAAFVKRDGWTATERLVRRIPACMT